MSGEEQIIPDTVPETAARLSSVSHEKEPKSDDVDSADAGQVMLAARLELPLAGTISPSFDWKADMVWIEGRELEWPSLDRQRNAASKSNLRRRCKGFRIDRTEVTNQQFAAFLSASSENLRFFDRRMDIVAVEAGQFRAVAGKEHFPVSYVDWLGAYSFAAWAGKSLPTEDEWILASLGERTLQPATTMYPWGTDRPDSLKLNSFHASSLPALMRVGSLPNGKSSTGVVDLAGNVAEWTLTGAASGKTSAASEDWMVTKGGSYLDLPAHCSVTQRAIHHRDERLAGLGFRCVVREKP
ncbi:formylglycine-generating enzyme family protein [bacterium]|nr:formylglycine-generating enzyme family protein [bacterium]